MRILLTGATGFVGKHLVHALISSGHEIFAIVRKTSTIKFLKEQNTKVYFIEEGLEKVFIENEIDGVIHIATSYGQNGIISEVYETNVLFPIKLLEFSVKYSSFFFINTDSFFTKSVTEYAYLNNYTNSKKLLTSLIEEFAPSITVVNLKLEHVYGENDGDNKFITQIIKKLCNNEPLVDLTEGLQKRDFVYIDDVVNAYLTVLNNVNEIKYFTSIEVGTGKSLTIREAVETIHKKTKSTSKLNFGALPTRVGEFKESYADIEMLIKMGWKVNYNFEDGIERTIKKTKKSIYGTD